MIFKIYRKKSLFGVCLNKLCICEHLNSVIATYNIGLQYRLQSRNLSAHKSFWWKYHMLSSAFEAKLNELLRWKSNLFYLFISNMIFAFDFQPIRTLRNVLRPWESGWHWNNIFFYPFHIKNAAFLQTLKTRSRTQNSQ